MCLFFNDIDAKSCYIKKVQHLYVKFDPRVVKREKMNFKDWVVVEITFYMREYMNMIHLFDDWTSKR